MLSLAVGYLLFLAIEKPTTERASRAGKSVEIPTQALANREPTTRSIGPFRVDQREARPLAEVGSP